MGRFLIRRTLQSIPVFIAITIISFALIHAVPGGPTPRLELDADIKPEDIARIKANMGLDKPVWQQYLIWVGVMPNNQGEFGGLLQGDLGISYIDQTSVTKNILDRLPNTLLLSITALVISFGLALPVGVLSAVKQYSTFDNVSTVLSTAGVSIPSFWFGLIAILFFSVELRWLPSGGMYTLGGEKSLADLLKHLIMPASILSILSIAGWNRYIRASMLEVIRQDYVRTARAKGLVERVVILGHALRNALIPVATLLGLSLPGLVSGSLITETIFGWPGMGRLTFHAATKRDYPIIMGALVMSTVLVILGNLLADAAYGFLDPRITAD
ncbi:MAG: ABC transporter permease [Anaerolineae bacterium]|nr:MAG: ABC transporter permease [Anaerolineae bacterium]